MPASPPLAPVVQLAGYCSIAAGLALDGQGLLGQLPSAFCGPAASALHAVDWPIGRPSSGRSAGGMQLLLSGSVAGHATTEVHEAAGLSRSQLLELFTGSAEDLAAPAVAADAAGCEAGMPDTPAGLTVAVNADLAAPHAADWLSSDVATAEVAGQMAVVGQQAAAALAAAPGLEALRVSTDSGSEKSVDAVIRIKQPAHSIGKPRAGRISNSSSNADSTSSLASNGTSSSSSAVVGFSTADAYSQQAAAEADPLAFLDSLPLYGQQDHAHAQAAEAATAAAASFTADGEVDGMQGELAVTLPAAHSQHSGLTEGLGLSVRGVYLLLVFAPFLLVGAPMLVMSWWLLTRAAAAQQHQVTPIQAPGDDSDSKDGSSDDSSSCKPVAVMDRLRHALVQHPQQLALQLLQQLWRLVLILFALVDLVLVLMLGGHWAAGVSAWESAGIWLRKHAWVLLHFSCSQAGPAFIKWGQWSSSRRDIFPADFCDAVSTFHDR